MKNVFFIIMVCCSTSLWFPAAAEEPPADPKENANAVDNPTTVDDGDKTSGWLNDLITGVDMAMKASDIAQGIKAGQAAWNTISKINFKDTKGSMDQAKAGALDKMKELVFQYKSNKLNFYQWLNNITTQVSDVLAGCNERLNRWRYTEPMLKAYYENMCLLANNTVECFKDFKIQDIIDIDRKWSRRLEGNLDKDYKFAMSFAGYMMKLGQEPYWWDKKFLNTFVPIDKNADPQYIKAFNYVDGITDPFNKIPFQYLLYSADCLSQIHDIGGEAYSASIIDPTQSEESYNNSIIEHSLDNSATTYKDVLDNRNLIAIQRSRVADQNRRLEQITAQLTAHYGRLLLQDQERQAEQFDNVNATFNKLANGGKIQTIDLQRVRILGEGAKVKL